MTYIGQTNQDYQNGGDYSIMQVPMIGKRFKPGKDQHGKWLDTIGERDNRIMVFKHPTTAHVSPAMKVYDSIEDISKDWEL